MSFLHILEYYFFYENLYLFILHVYRNHDSNSLEINSDFLFYNKIVIFNVFLNQMLHLFLKIYNRKVFKLVMREIILMYEGLLI